MNIKIEFAQRLKKAMVDAGYDPRPGVLEKGFNTHYYGKSVSFQAASNWLKGISLPSQDKLEVLASWLNVEPQYLRFGDLASKTVQQRRKSWEDAMAGQEREVLEAYFSLPADQKKVARAVILALAQANTKHR